MNYDIIVQIAEHLSPQPYSSSTHLLPPDPKATTFAYRTLYALSLVSKSCASAAAKILYHDIVISPESDGTQGVLDLKSRRWRPKEGEKVPDQVESSMLPQNSLFVTNLEISGFVPEYMNEGEDKDDNTTSLANTIFNAILFCWPNLTSVTVTPEFGRPFGKALSALMSLSVPSLYPCDPPPEDTSNLLVPNTNPPSSGHSLSSIPEEEDPLPSGTETATAHSVTSAPSFVPRYSYNLKHLHITSQSCEPALAPLFHHLRDLETLTIEDPTRHYLEELPRWVEKLTTEEGKLHALHLKNDCGSITPGVLKLLKPHMANIRSFSFGLSYSITNDELFDFLGCMPLLEDLDVRYYIQNRPLPDNLPPSFLARLHTLTLRYTSSDIEQRSSVTTLARWLTTLLSHNHESLHSASIIRSTKFSLGGGGCIIDEIIECLLDISGPQLKRVWIPNGFVSVEAIVKVCEMCGSKGLEEMRVKTSSRVLDNMDRILASCPTLHTLALRFSTYKLPPIDEAAVRRYMNDGKSKLRRLLIGSELWEGSWASAALGNGAVEYVIERRWLEGDECDVDESDEDEGYSENEDL